MTVFDAPPVDVRRERRRKVLTVVLVAVVLLAAALAWTFRNWSAEHRVSQFFAALQKSDYETGYGIWMADQNWKQHPDAANLKRYPFNEFRQDWGPGGEWGLIRSYHVGGSTGAGSGVVVVVTVNERKEQARLWYEKKDKTLTFSPY